VNAQDRFGHTPLWDTIDTMNKEAALLVRDAGGKIQEDGVAQRMCEHAKKNHVAVFELLHSVKLDLYVRVRHLSAKCHA
jgi:citrate lyase beta subunit